MQTTAGWDRTPKYEGRNHQKQATEGQKDMCIIRTPGQSTSLAKEYEELVGDKEVQPEQDNRRSGG